MTTLDSAAFAAALAATKNVELPDDLRIPLHGLQADLDWLVARILNDPDEADQFKDSIRNRLSQIESASYRLVFSALPHGGGAVEVECDDALNDITADNEAARDDEWGEAGK